MMDDLQRLVEQHAKLQYMTMGRAAIGKEFAVPTPFGIPLVYKITGFKEDGSKGKPQTSGKGDK